MLTTLLRPTAGTISIDGKDPVLHPAAVRKSYGIDALRAFLINMSHFSLGTDLAVPVLFSGVFLAFGSYFFSKIQA